jgi:hypothetical protein
MNTPKPAQLNPVINPRPRVRLAEGGFRAGLVVFTCLFLSWFMFAADFAGATPYKGKTKGGNAVTFNLAGTAANGIRTLVPTICLETTGNYSSRAGGELFQPAKTARIGRTVKSKALQPAALNMGIKATKNYEVKLRRSGKVVSGKLSLNFSFLVPDLYGASIFICSGTTTFTARPR